jgi:cytochrome c biogenesis protein ResB
MPRAVFRKAWGSLSQLRTGIALLVLLLAAAVVTTLFPQLPHQADGGAWWAAVQDRYGFLYGPLRALGFFNLSAALWFDVILGLLLASTLACLLKRVLPLSRVVFRPRVRIPGERFERAPLTADMRFRSTSAAQSIISEALRRRRYRVRVEKHTQPDDSGRRGFHLRADRNSLPRLGTLLTHLGVILLVIGAGLSGLRGWRTSALEVKPGAVTNVGHGAKVGLRCEEFTVYRYADGTPREYSAEVTLVAENGEKLAQEALRINRPFTYAGVDYYLQGFSPSSRPSIGGESPESCALMVAAVRDPGFLPAVLAGLCLLVGVTLTFHFPHRRIWARTDATGYTTLAGSTAWDKARFDQQFEELVAELTANGWEENGVL